MRAPAPLARWLAGKTRGERRFLAAILVVVMVVLVWAAIWQPLVRDAVAMRAAQNGSAAALAEAHRMTDEIAGLARISDTPVTADARGSLERVLAQQNLRSVVTQLDWQDGRARVVFTAVRFDALIVVLEALQRDAHLRAIEATITARVEPGMVRAEFALAR
jgi:type II secretory pathway component PulM